MNRFRRLRTSEEIRRLVRETHVNIRSLIYPVFVAENIGEKQPVESMPEVYQYPLSELDEIISRCVESRIGGVLLFGIPAHKDESASSAYDDNGITQQAIRFIKKNYPELPVIADVCLCEYTSHGHCGVLCGHDVENDATLDLLSRTALSHVQAGADMVAPSDMMDGRILAIRNRLDENGFKEVPIMSYAVKYASAFYGPFRDAAGSAPSFGDRKSYQMDPHNSREGIKEALLDVEEGADIIMVKPAMNYLDMITKVKDVTNVPIAAYSTSAEYAMVKAAAQMNWVDEERIMCEMAVSAYRAGAQIYLTYYAKELAKCIEEGKIG